MPKAKGLWKLVAAIFKRAPKTCPVCGCDFVRLSGGVMGCATHGIR